MACVALLMLSAAAGAVEPPADAASSPTAVAQVPVLLHLSLTVDGQPRDALKSVRLFTAPLDSLEAPRPLAPQALTAPGWISVSLVPGSHFLLVLPPGMDQDPPALAYHAPTARYGRLVRYGAESVRGASWQAALGGFVYSGAAPDHFIPLEGFLLRVPPAVGAVYGGSLAVACTNGAGLLGTLIRVCSDVSVADHHADALAIAPSGPAPVDLPVTPYGAPMVALDFRGEGLIVELVHKTSAVTAANRGAMPAGAPLQAIGPGPAVGIFNLLMIAGTLAADSSNARAAAAKAEQWRPCLEDLAAESAAADLDAAIRDGAVRARQAALEADRQRGPIPARAGMIDFNLAISLVPQQLQMVPCRDADRYCLEVAMRVTVDDLMRKRAMFDAVILSADALGPGDPARAARGQLQLPADDRPAARTMQDWCGKDRVALFRQAIGRASESIVRSALQRMQRPM